MSTINTNGINVNYPIPGVNNSSQGFRDNFASIRTNLNVAGTEITDLQNKVVLKAALENTTLNNDMANTLISNASTRSFRATTYNLGNSLSGTVLIDVSLGDVQYGTVAGNVTLQFGGWAPSGTQSNLQLQLAVSNSLAVISFPSEVVFANNNFGVTTLENYANTANVPTVTIPYNVSQVDYRLSTMDCGTSIIIEPYNRPRITTQVQERLVPPTGFQGDVSGTVSVDANYIYVCTSSYDSGGSNTITKTGVVATYSGNLINCTSNTSLVLNSPIMFSGNVFGGIAANTVYYIKSMPDAANITISDTGFDGTAGNAFAVTPATGTMTATSYNGTHIWKRIDLASVTGGDTVTGNLSVAGWANVAGNIVASNASLGNLTTSNFYAGTLTTAAQPNITSVGTLTSLAVTGNISGANVTATHYGAATGLTAIPGANVTGTVPLATSATTAGTVTTAAQPNITSTGTLSSLTVTGNMVAGNVVSAGAVTSNNTSGIGYATGAGGTVTQTGSRTDAVTINKTTGAITLFSAAGSAAYQTFTVNNSTVAATDVIIVNQKSGTDLYEVYITNIQSGTFQITFATTGGTTTEQPVLNFAVIKGVDA
jgi:hypothetical protein